MLVHLTSQLRKRKPYDGVPQGYDAVAELGLMFPYLMRWLSAEADSTCQAVALNLAIHPVDYHFHIHRCNVDRIPLERATRYLIPLPCLPLGDENRSVSTSSPADGSSTRGLVQLCAGDQSTN